MHFKHCNFDGYVKACCWCRGEMHLIMRSFQQSPREKLVQETVPLTTLHLWRRRFNVARLLWARRPLVAKTSWIAGYFLPNIRFLRTAKRQLKAATSACNTPEGNTTHVKGQNLNRTRHGSLCHGHLSLLGAARATAPRCTWKQKHALGWLKPN